MTPVPKFLRHLWARALLRGVHYSDRYRQLEGLYQMEDPWNMESARERFRFVETNRIIEREFGRPGRILEVGCGEGHQSRYLAEICEHLYGCDVSERAVERARTRCPTAEFSVGDLAENSSVASSAPFDLVVACEVLYYMRDVRGAVALMSQLGRACLVTYFDKHREKLDALVVPPTSAGRSVIVHDDVRWTAVWWRNDLTSTFK